MVFANLVFIYLFLPLNLIFYFLRENQAYRNTVLICFSFLFYAWGEPVWVLLLLFCDRMLPRKLDCAFLCVCFFVDEFGIVRAF